MNELIFLDGQWVVPDGIDTDQISDGFHTFRELYDHRRALTAALCRFAGSGAWRSKNHHPENDPMYEGYFIVGINLYVPRKTVSMAVLKTITYHYQLKHWDDFAGTTILEHSPKWDGSTPQDTVSTLLQWAQDR